MTLAVYAVTDAVRVPRTTGVRGERLRLYREGAIAAVAGEIQHALRPSADTLRRYDGTVRRLAASLSAVVPARFGTRVADAEELRRALRARQHVLRRAVSRVRNRVQMTVRLIGEPAGDGEAAEIAAQRRRGRGEPSLATPAVEASESGTRYLRARADAVRRADEVAGVAAVRAAVQRWVRDERVERRGGVASVYHLIPGSAAAAYQRAALRAAADAGLRVVVTGPWPAYAFVDW